MGIHEESQTLQLLLSVAPGSSNGSLADKAARHYSSHVPPFKDYIGAI